MGKEIIENKRIKKNLYMSLKYALKKLTPSSENYICPSCGGVLTLLPFLTYYRCFDCGYTTDSKPETKTLDSEGDKMIRQGIESLMNMISIQNPDVLTRNSWGEMLQELPNGDCLSLYTDCENGYDEELASPFASICLETKDKEGNPCVMDIVTVEAPTKALQEYNKSIDNPTIQNTGDLEIRVYADPWTEDYTNKFVINNDEIQKVINE